MEIGILVFLIQGIIFGGFCAYIATQKNRDKVDWFFLGFFFSILAVLALIAIPIKNNPDQLDASLRNCPNCAELVKKQAIICRFCQKELPVLSSYSKNNTVNLQENASLYRHKTDQAKLFYRE